MKAWIAGAALLFASAAHATVADPKPWEQVLFGADFAGIVECKTAGELVARYTVIESWKGPAAGSEVLLAMAAPAWGPHSPVALVGERMVVAARRPLPRSVPYLPVRWRQLSVDYELPEFQGMHRLPLSREPEGVFGPEPGALDGYRATAVAFLRGSRADQEAALIQLLVRKYFSPADQARVAGIAKATAVGPMIQALVAFEEADPDKAQAVDAVLAQAGPLTLAALEQVPAARRSSAVVHAIERLTWPWGRPRAASPEPAGLSKKEAQRLRDAMKASTDDLPDEALAGLSRGDCAALARHLASGSVALGYGRAAYLAWRCGPDRSAGLKLLLKARDPWVQVAAATWLQFEDAALGAAQLRERMRLPGDPGAWAAISLARRGEKDAVPRALEIFSAVRGPEGSELQGRLCTLLSNATVKARAPLPTGCRWAPTLRAELEAWWKANGATAVISDPWLGQLAAQKVD